MSLSTEISAIEQWWHTLISHLFTHPAAASVAPAAIAAAASASQSVGIDYSKYPTAASAYIPNGLPAGWSWDAWMAAHPGVADPRTTTAGGEAIKPSTDPSVPADGLYRDGIVRYFHHTEVAGPSCKLTTEALTGKTKLQLTYTSQEAGKTAPNQAWASVNGGPEQGPMQCGANAEWDLGDSGTPSIDVRFDTNGRMIGQLITG